MKYQSAEAMLSMLFEMLKREHGLQDPKHNIRVNYHMIRGEAEVIVQNYIYC